MFLIKYIPLIISLVALIISVFALYLQNAEYFYKLDPVITVGVNQLKFSSDYHNTDIKVQDFVFEIKEVNNLEKIYFIDSNYDIVKLPEENFEGAFSENANRVFSKDESDLETENYHYYYFFALLMGLDDDAELNLFYVKSEKSSEKEQLFQINKVDKITLLQLQKQNLDDPNYEGERIMARQFEEINNYYSQFLI